MGTVEDLLPSLVPDPVQVLYVEDDEDFAELAVEFLESEDRRLSVTSVESAESGLEVLGEGVDCIVSDYEMPGMNGIEFLEAVRERDRRVPFIFFTGKGSEEVASEAISKNVTDYLRKEAGSDQFHVLLTRIINAVEQYRAEDRLYRAFETLYSAQQSLGIVDDDGRYLFVNPSYAASYGLQPEDLVGKSWHHLYPEEEVERFEQRILPKLENDRSWHGTATALKADGTRVTEEIRVNRIGDGGHVRFVTVQ